MLSVKELLKEIKKKLTWCKQDRSTRTGNQASASRADANFLANIYNVERSKFAQAKDVHRFRTSPEPVLLVQLGSTLSRKVRWYQRYNVVGWLILNSRLPPPPLVELFRNRVQLSILRSFKSCTLVQWDNQGRLHALHRVNWL